MADDINVDGSLSVDLTLQVNEKSKKNVEASIKELEGKLNGDLGLNVNKESINHVISTINNTLVPALRKSISDGFKKGLEDGLKSINNTSKKINIAGTTSGSSSTNLASSTKSVAKDTDVIKKNYGDIIQKINQSAKALSKLTGESKDYSAEIDKITKQTRDASTGRFIGVEGRRSNLESLNNDIQNQIDKIKEAQKVYKLFETNLSSYNKGVSKYSSASIDQLWGDESRSKLHAMLEEIERVSQIINTGGTKGAHESLVNYYNSLIKDYNKELVVAQEETKKYKNDSGLTWNKVASDIRNTIKELSKYNDEGTKGRRDDLTTKLNSLLDKSTGSKSGSPESIAKEFDVLNSEVKKYIDNLNEAEEELKKHNDELKETRQSIKNIASGALLKIGASFVTYFTNQFRQIINYVVEIDDALTQVAIVTNNSVKGLSDFADEAVDASQRVGASVVDIMKSVETWARLGYNLSDSTNLAATTAMFSNVAATSVDDATTSLTAILKGFNLSASEAESVIDKLTLVGQKYAISAGELGTALQKGGAALYAGGNSLEESIAIIAAANSAVQNADTVGTTMKTVSARIRAAKTELEEMGEDIEGVASSASKMRGEILALSGVDIMTDRNTFKSTYQILLEIAEVWDSLSDVSRANLLEKIAGKRGVTVIQSVITNIKDMTGAYSDAMNAMGTASKANEIYLDSISGRMNILKTNVQEFAQAVFNSDLFKGIITVLSKVTSLVTLLVSHTGILLPILSVLLGVVTKLSDKWKTLIELISSGSKHILSNFSAVFTILKKIVSGLQFDVAHPFQSLSNSLVILKGNFAEVGQAVAEVLTPMQLLMAKLALVAAVAYLVYKGIEFLGSGYQRAAEKAQKAAEEYDKSNKRLEELNSELETNAARIREIRESGPITIIEQKEIETLQAANAALAEQIQSQKALTEEQKRQAQEAAINAAQKWGSGYQEWWYALANGDMFDMSNGALIERTIEQSKTNLDANRAELLNYWQEVQDILGTLVDEEGNVIADGEEMYAKFKQYSDDIYELFDPVGFTRTKINEVLSRDEFEDIVEYLKTIDEVTEETFDGDRFEDFKRALAEVGVEEKDLDKVVNLLNDDIKSAKYNQAFDDLSSSIAGANDALNKFKNASEAEKDDPYKGFVDAEKKVIEEITNGRLYSNTFKSGVSLLLGDDWLEKSAEEQAKQIQKIQKYFKFDDDSGLTFLDAMIDKSKELKKEWVTLDDDDNFVVNIKPDDYEEIAKAFGMSAEAVKVLVAALGNYIELDPFHDDEIAKAFIENGVIMENGILNLKEAREVLSSMGMDDDRIEKTIDYIMQMGDASQKVDLSNIEDALEFFVGEDNDWGVMDNGVVDALNLLERMQRLSFSDTDIYDFLTALKESGDVPAANLDEALRRISETDLEKPKTEVEDVNTKIEDAIENAMKFRRITYQQGIESMDQYATSVSKTAGNFKTLVYWLDQVINLMPLAGGYRGVVSSTVFGGSEAEGTKSAPRGISLTGEEGPEIIYNAASHTSSIVGLNGPEFVRLQGGEVILNASDTKRVFGNSVGLSERYGSYVTGTGSLDILRKYGTHTSYYTGGTGSSSSGTTNIKSLLKSSKDSADAAYNMAVEEIEKRVDALKDEEDALKDAADAAKDLADAEKDALKNEYDIAKEAIQDRIDTIEKEYDSAADGLDKEIERLKEQLTLLKETNEQEDKALKLQQAIDAYEAAKRAKTARVYTSDKGWIWVADPDAVKNAKDTLDELYKEYARDDAEKAINDQIDAIEKQKDAMKEEADAQKQVLEDLSKAWAEQIEKMDYSVEEYQKYIETLTKYTEMSVGDMTESINEFGNQVAEVMQLNTEANNAKEAYDAFKEIADLEIEKLNELKKKWSEYKSHVSKTLEEYNEELNYASKYSVMSFDEMAQAAEDYMAKVKEIMKLNSQNAASKGYASGSTSIPSTGAKIVDEYGQELIVHKPDLGHYAWLEKGDGVVPADITRRLMALGTNPAAYLSAYAKSAYKGLSGVNTSTTNYNFGGDIVLNNVKDAKSFFTEFEQEINLRQTR